MQLVRRRETWEPFREFEDLANRMNRLFGLARLPTDGERETLATTDWTPSCDISETDQAYRIHAELPAVKKDDVHVTLDNGVLTIRGERRSEKEEKDVRFHRRELFVGSFARQFTLPADADEGKVDASFKDGMLNIVIPKAPAKSPRSKEVAVH